MVITDLVAGYGYTTSMYGAGTPTASVERCLRLVLAGLYKITIKNVIEFLNSQNSPFPRMLFLYINIPRVLLVYPCIVSLYCIHLDTSSY